MTSPRTDPDRKDTDAGLDMGTDDADPDATASPDVDAANGSDTLGADADRQLSPDPTGTPGQGSRHADVAGSERLIGLLLTASLGAVLLALAVGLTGRPSPLLPRQVMLAGGLGVIPAAIFLVLASARPGSHLPLRGHSPRAGLWPRTLRFAVPAAAVAASATFAAYTLAEDTVGDSRAEARTVATITLLLVILWVTVMLTRRSPSRGHIFLVAGTAATFALAMAVPALRDLFDLELGSAPVVLSALGVAAIASVALELAWQVSGWDKGK